MAADEKAAGIDRREGWIGDAEAISPTDGKAIEILLSALIPISDLRDRPIPLPFAVVFLSVVLNEGLPVGSYAKGSNMTRFAMFKYLQSIGDRGRHNAAGLGLVAIERGHGARTAVFLTDKGRAVAAQVLEKLRGDRRAPKTKAHAKSSPAGSQQGEIGPQGRRKARTAARRR
jgi:hypothetical protein